ncbi:MAG: hypothetical protein ACU4F9_05960 [Arcticibacter sp.]
MKSHIILAIIALSLYSQIGISQDRIFTYTYQSNTLAPGQKELEIWTTLRTGREDFYRSLDNRIEFEVGIAKNLQTAFYLNSFQTAQETRFVDNLANQIVSIEKSIGWSFSNEWKLKLSDPVGNVIGSALYGEFTIAPTETELEFKLILDKKTGPFFHALNLVSEFEFETELSDDDGKLEIETEEKTKLKLVYGIARNLNQHWHIGLESFLKAGQAKDPMDYMVLFAGPGCSYSKGSFWLNLTIMPQVAGLLHPTEGTSGLYLEKEEKLQTRLMFSYVF